MLTTALPIPPLEMRELVGPTDEAAFDNPAGKPIFGNAIELDLYESVFDFGCGCGRIARKLLQQTPRPDRYLGIDLHAGMIRWDIKNLAIDGFEFQHHDVFNRSFNPRGVPTNLPFPAEDHSASLVIAYSVFTHLAQAQCEHYLREVARILKPDGVMISTWFLFDKRGFPMMQDFQNTLYINDVDVTNATIFDRDWMVNLASSLGLTIRSVQAPDIRGFHWTLQFTPAHVPAAPWPEDSGPIGHSPPPVSQRWDPSRVGLDDLGLDQVTAVCPGVGEVQ